MTDYEFEQDRTDAFFPFTTDGVQLLVGSEVVDNEKDVRVGLGDVVGAQALMLLPSHARELGRQLIEVADALDAEFPGSPNR